MVDVIVDAEGEALVVEGTVVAVVEGVDDNKDDDVGLLFAIAVA